ncbi:MAG: hypothetical protein Q4D38_08230 [Planctomycetia bacterium]|nr:hypothetical protein [Planctomycetia bacterium]
MSTRSMVLGGVFLGAAFVGILIFCIFYTHSTFEKNERALEEIVLRDIETVEVYFSDENETSQKWREYLDLESLKQLVADSETPESTQGLFQFTLKVADAEGFEEHRPLETLAESLTLLRTWRKLSFPWNKRETTEEYIARRNALTPSTIVFKEESLAQESRSREFESAPTSSKKVLPVANIEADDVLVSDFIEADAGENLSREESPAPSVSTAQNAEIRESASISHTQTTVAWNETTPAPSSISMSGSTEEESTASAEEGDSAEKSPSAVPVPPEPQFASSLLTQLENPQPVEMLKKFRPEEIENSVFLQTAQLWALQSEIFCLPTNAQKMEARLVLIHEAKELEAFLDRSREPNASKWKRALMWDKLKPALDPKNDVSLEDLRMVHACFSTGVYGMELQLFAKVRVALENYLGLHACANESVARARHMSVAKKLATLLILADKNPNGNVQRGVESALRWMTWMGQAPDLVENTRNLWNFSNIAIHFNQSVFQNFGENAIERDQKVRENIYNATITGNSHFSGRLGISPITNDNFIELEISLAGTATGQTNAHAGPAIITSVSSNRVEATKRIRVKPDGLSSTPAVANISGNSEIVRVQDRFSRPMVESAAERRAYARKDETQGILLSRNESRLERELNESIDPALQKWERQISHDILFHLAPRGLRPANTTMWSDPAGAHVKTEFACNSGLMAPTLPPEIAENCDIQIAIHESALQNIFSGFLSGMKLDSSARTQFQTGAPQWLKNALESAPKENSEAAQGQNDDSWELRFPCDYPISTNFDENTVSLTIQADRIINEDKTYPAINIAVTYAFVTEGEKCFLVRQDGIEMLPPDFNPEVQKRLPAQIISLRRVLSRRLKDIFPERVEVREIALGENVSGEGAAALSQNMTLAPVFLQSCNGWLQIGFCVREKK